MEEKIRIIDELDAKVGGRFKLTALLQKRIRELVAGAPRLVDIRSDNPIDAATASRAASSLAPCLARNWPMRSSAPPVRSGTTAPGAYIASSICRTPRLTRPRTGSLAIIPYIGAAPVPVCSGWAMTSAVAAATSAR